MQNNTTNTMTAILQKKAEHHPCYSEDAHYHFSRIHLPVAPACNIQCNFCNRKYDCSNESRPGVVSEKLTPKEALHRIQIVAATTKELSVAGIAGPGDPLANPTKTFETMALIKKHYPDLKLCLATNGLVLPELINQIKNLGVDHVTVTVNALTVETAKKVYAWVKFDGKKQNNANAMFAFLQNQLEGIKKLLEAGILVKINTVLIPGINDHEIQKLNKKMQSLGVFIHNIMPLIAKQEHGSVFGLRGQQEPSNQEVEAMRKSCGILKQMSHCRQCRADAVGKLDQDLFKQYSKSAEIQKPAPVGNGEKERNEWKKQVKQIKNCQNNDVYSFGFTPPKNHQTFRVAVCSKADGLINLPLGKAKEFYIFQVNQNRTKLINVRQLDQKQDVNRNACLCGTDQLSEVYTLLKDCHAIISSNMGHEAFDYFESRKILPIVDTGKIPMDQAVLQSISKIFDFQSEHPITCEAV